MKITYKILIILGLLSSTLIGKGLMINYKFSKIKIKATFYSDNEAKFWAHHGYSINGEPYKVKNVKLAITRGIKGVELDLFYNAEKRKFMVVHDKSEEDTLSLNEILKELTNQPFYWFDLKNLTENNVEHIIQDFSLLDEEYNLQNRFIIESKKAKELRKLSINGFYTCLWISIPKKNNVIKDFYWGLKNKNTLINNDYSAISMPYYYYVQEGKSRYKNFPIHCWVNPEEYEKNKEEILFDDKLKIVLFDRR